MIMIANESYQNKLNTFRQKANDFDEKNEEIFAKEKSGIVKFGFGRFLLLGAMISFKCSFVLYTKFMYFNALEVPPTSNDSFTSANM